MGYNKKSYLETKELFRKREQKARDDALLRKEEVYSAVPEIKDIDRLLASTAAEIAIEIAKGKYELEQRIDSLKDKNLALQKKRGEILVANGYPADYTKIKYQCERCEDTGAVGTSTCECFHREVVKASIRNSGIGALVDSQSFDSFELRYYANDKNVLSVMRDNFETLKAYADTFTEDSSSMLFIGPTGLGKTHLSTSIARCVIEKGYDVVYDTAQNVFSDFEYERFGRGYSSRDEDSRTDKYFDCNLLIIDDLGTEVTNAFTVACLYNLINSRTNSNKPTIINTNLNNNELKQRYDDRITSRLLGEFAIVMFSGTDIRQLKMK